MGKPQKTIELLWGIPGSGKTTYAKQWAGTGCGRSSIDVDKIFKNSDPSRMFANLNREVQDVIYGRDNILIDGLVTTNAVAKKIFDELSASMSNSYDLIFKITWWERDVEAALHNDKYRPGRNQRSDITIENIPFEKPDMKILGEYVKDRVTRKRIVRKPDSEVWIYTTVGTSLNTLESSSWSLGGTWGDCWGGKGNVDAEPQPAGFKEFDELVEKICPNIGFLQYKRLYNETVKIEDYGYGDYYGGYRRYAKFQCDLVKLYEMLNEMGLIETSAE